MEPHISVIIPTFNRRHFLREALDSVAAQTYPFFEIIVIDDGSDDGTDELISQYDREINYIRQDNRGPAAARNRGIRAARYDFIAFLDSDDRFAENKLAIQLHAMLDNPGFLVSHTDEIWYRRGSLLNQKKKHLKEGGFIFARCLELCAVGMSTIMANKALFDEVGLFDEGLPCCEDYDLWLRTAVSHSFLHVPHPLTIKNGGRPDQLSTIHRIGMDRFRIASIQKVLRSGLLNEEQAALAAEELARKSRIYGNGCLKHGRPEEGRYYLDLAREVSQ